MELEFKGNSMYVVEAHSQKCATLHATPKFTPIMKSYTLQLFLRKNKSGNGNTSQLYARLQSKGVSVYASLGVTLKSNEWDTRKQEFRASSLNAVLNRDILKIKTRFAKVRESVLFDKEHSKEELKIHLNQILANDQIVQKVEAVQKEEVMTEITLRKIFTDFLEASLDKKPGTIETYNSTRVKIEGFGDSFDLDVRRIDLRWLKSFEKYLKDEHGNGINTIWKDMKNLRACFNHAIKEEVIDSKTYPFRHYSLKSEKVRKPALTNEELSRLESYKAMTILEQTCKDLFIFSSYSGGLRYSDCVTLKMKHLHDLKFIQKDQAKTSDTVKLPLNSKSILIVSRYFDAEIPESYLFPVVPIEFDAWSDIEKNDHLKRKLALINKTLKRIAFKLEIYKNVSFHMARRTFAWRANEIGADLPSIARLMGHKSTSQTEEYITPNQVHLNNLISKL